MSLLFDVIKKIKGKDIRKAYFNLRQFRVSTCKNCKHFLRTGNCNICGCFIVDKSSYLLEQCPIKKW